MAHITLKPLNPKTMPLLRKLHGLLLCNLFDISDALAPNDICRPLGKHGTTQKHIYIYIYMECIAGTI